jgi:hypothetical protein
MPSNSLMLFGGDSGESRRSVAPLGRSARKTLMHLSDHTITTMAATQAEGMITRSKIREIVETCEYGIIKCSDTYDLVDRLAGGNPIKHEDLRHLATIMKLGVATVAQDMLDDLRQL